MARQSSSFARRLQDLRDAAELSGAELARRAGISRHAFAQLESGEREPSWEEVKRLARGLETDCMAFDGDGKSAAGSAMDRLVEAARGYARAYDEAEQRGRDGRAPNPEVFGRFQDAQVELNLAALDLFAAEAVCPLRAAAHQQAGVGPSRPRRKTAKK